MNILKKEHFNRWFSLSSYYISVTLVDLPVSIICCILFSGIVYFMSGQPLEVDRFSMFFAISLLVAFVAQSFGLMIGAVFDVVVSRDSVLPIYIGIEIVYHVWLSLSERNLPRTNALCPDDDVRRFRSYPARLTAVFKMGKLRQLSSIWTGGVSLLFASIKICVWKTWNCVIRLFSDWSVRSTDWTDRRCGVHRVPTVITNIRKNC